MKIHSIQHSINYFSHMHHINTLEKLHTRVLIMLINAHLTYSHMLHTRGNLQNVIAYLTINK